MEPLNDPDARADALLDQMSLDEQIGLLHGDFPLMMNPRPEGVQRSAGYVAGLPRLGIPALTESDASLGVSAAGRRDDLATALPGGLALASSWSLDLAFEAGATAGAEARAKGFNVLLAGGVNLTREPRNGRNFEYLGEDPLLAGKLAGAAIRGVQSNHIVSTIKHFALNSQETGRMVMSANIGEAGFRESDLLAFQLAIEDGQPGSVMCAYNRVGGTYASEHRGLLTDVLKRDWGYPGWVMSDWGAVHSLSALDAGLDQQSGQQLDRARFFSDQLREALAKGEADPARVRDAAHRVLRAMIANGLMEHPTSPGEPDLAAGAEVAQRAAEAGIVLLKNDGVLPLEGVRRIAVIGGHADMGVLSGGGSSQVIPKGSTRFDPPAGAPFWSAGVILHPDPPLGALREALPNVGVVFDNGADPDRAAQAAAEADVAIVFAVQWATEAMDTGLSLPDGQDELIAAVAAANRRTVVVLQTGNPVLMPWLDQVAAVLEAWYPGSGGGEAIARILTGAVNPSGRLPISFPASADQLAHPKLPGSDLPVNARGDPPPFDVDYHEGSDVGYRWFARSGGKPLFPFGFGRSYAHFTYAGLGVGGDGLRVSLEVTNTGDLGGTDTPQLYLTAGPWRRQQRLLGWTRVTLQPGETRRVDILAEPRLLADWDVEAHAFLIRGGRYELFVGPDAATPVLIGVAEIAAANLGP